MCLAFLKKEGTPYSEFIEESIINSYSGNRDGIGFALKRNGDIIIRKGLFNPSQIIDILRKLEIKPNEELLVHLRMGTSGEVINTNCHPFILSKEEEECVLDDSVTNLPVLIHNGVFSRNEYDITNKNYSDTFHLTNQYFAEPAIIQLMYNNKELFERITKPIINSNRVLIMFPEENKKTIILGSFSEDNGILFSNSSYKSYNNYYIQEEIGYNATKRSYNVPKKQNFLSPSSQEEIELSRTLIKNSKNTVRLKVDDLLTGVIVEVQEPITLDPIHKEDIGYSFILAYDLLKLLYQFDQYIDLSYPNESYWRVEVISGNVKYEASISEELLLDSRSILGKVDKNGNLVCINGNFIKKSSLFNDNIDSKLFENLPEFDPSKMTRTRIKKIRKALDNAKKSTSEKSTIRIDNKNHGPLHYKFYEMVLERYEKYKTNEESNLFTAGF